jgi:hypothetical protein
VSEIKTTLATQASSDDSREPVDRNAIEQLCSAYAHNGLLLESLFALEDTMPKTGAAEALEEIENLKDGVGNEIASLEGGLSQELGVPPDDIDRAWEDLLDRDANGEFDVEHREELREVLTKELVDKLLKLAAGT